MSWIKIGFQWALKCDFQHHSHYNENHCFKIIISRHFPDRYKTDDNDDERCHHIQPRRVYTADKRIHHFTHMLGNDNNKEFFPHIFPSWRGVERSKEERTEGWFFFSWEYSRVNARDWYHHAIMNVDKKHLNERKSSCQRHSCNSFACFSQICT